MTDKIRVLHFSPHREDDGIAKYQQHYVEAMDKLSGVTNTFFDTSPLRLRFMSKSEKEQTLNRLREQLKGYDILHVQHEFGLFNYDEFAHLVEHVKKAHKKIIVTIHLSPGFAIKTAKINGLGPRSWLHYARQKRYYNKQVNWHIKPLKSVDLVIVHNDVTKNSLTDFGVNGDKIVKMIHPVPVVKFNQTSNTLSQKLNKKPSDVIFCTVGMMHRYKGVFDAIKALKFLPDNYKLAIIGGVHPFSEDVPIYNKACDLVDQLGLGQRVYITGFVKDDDEMNALIRECAIAIFPYNGKYYGHVSSGAINLAIANHLPVIAYPTAGFVALSENSAGAVVLTQTYAYYELAREIQSIHIKKQAELSKEYAEKMSWLKSAKNMARLYSELINHS